MAYIGHTPAEKYVSLSAQHFTVTATANYTLSNSVTNENEIALFINNVRQQPGGSYAYTAAGTTLTLSAATAGTDTMYCVYLGKAVGTINPPDGSVNSATIVDGSITDGDLAGSISSAKITSLDATKLTGTVAEARLATLDASKLTGTVADARITTLTASKLSGVVPTANLGTGTASSTTVLYGDGTYKAEPVTADEITKSTSEPLITTNPAGGVGSLWLRTTTGEMYCCTDDTTNANSWTNIGDGSGDITPTIAVDFLVIGGGAGSAYGGGGAGGYRNSFSTETSGGNSSSQTPLAVWSGTVYTITVGAGGAAGVGNAVNTGAQGANSTITGADITTITSTGGGYGGGYNTSAYAVPGTGGSGGGGGPSGNPPGAAGTAGEGFAGGGGIDGGGIHRAGGGGGASEVGVTGTVGAAPDGGDGLSSSITGSAVTRAGGGGGGALNTTAGAAGSGGGGAGTTAGGTAGTANTGGGAGGCNHVGFPGEAGGSGVVILRMATADYSGTTSGSPAVSTLGSDTILVFNSDGTYTG